MALLHVDFFSDVLGMCTSADVILPQQTSGQIGMEGKGAEGKLKTMYLLHGMSDDQTIWQRRTSIERYVSQLGIAVVMPTTHLAFYTDTTYGMRYWTYISEELPKICREFFPQMSDKKEDNLAAGLSMGGYGAWKLGLGASETFGAAASLSGCLDIIEDVGRHLEGDSRDAALFRGIYGSLEQLEGSDNDLMALAKKLKTSGKPIPRLYSWCGTEDFLYEGNKRAWEYMKEHGIDEIVVHAPYIINLGNSVKPETFSLAVEFLAKEIDRTIACRSHTLILHPGAHVGAGVEIGTAQIIKGLNEVLTAETDCCIALETMAGKGSEIGRNFEELARIYDGVVQNDKLRVCFDTCHTSDSGYDIIHHFDDVMESFDRLLGKDQIAVFHINDSKNIPGAAKDRHENIGFGEIGFDAISTIVHHPDFESVPKILETPYIPSVTKAKKSYAPYKYEIEMLRNNRFDPEMKDHILADCE